MSQDNGRTLPGISTTLPEPTETIGMEISTPETEEQIPSLTETDAAKGVATSSTEFKFAPFSLRQKKVLTWWMPGSPFADFDGIIADGSIRSGKTMSMSLSFVIWAMQSYDGMNFGLCGKSIGSLRRNVINGLKQMLGLRGYRVRDRRNDNLLIVSRGKRHNNFYMFGGRDESSQDLIQGITLAGVLLDEVALMPESFVNQATGRCSVEGAKLWFNCNPDNRLHWFKLFWINVYRQKKLLYLHFTMDDNLSLSEHMKERYESRYVGVFYRRYILGEWVSADGIIYDMWSGENTYDPDELKKVNSAECRRYVACDYGTTNPMVFLDCLDDGQTFWIRDEYYWDSKVQQSQKTDSEYANDFEKFVDYDKAVRVILDPSAESFRMELRNRGYHVVEADNTVLDGIRITATMIQRRRLRVQRGKCPNLLHEVESYIWDEKASMRGEEKPLKEHDHCLTGDTLVKTVSGNKPLKSLIGKIGLLFCYDEKRRRRRIGLFFGARLARRMARIYRVELENGQTIRGTGDHKVLTESGWKEIRYLTNEDRVISIGG